MIPQARSNLRATLQSEVVVTDASPSASGAAVAAEFKSKFMPKEKKAVSQLKCVQCHRMDAERLAECPRTCGAPVCGLACAQAHCGVCLAPKRGQRCFGEALSSDRAGAWNPSGLYGLFLLP